MLNPQLTRSRHTLNRKEGKEEGEKEEEGQRERGKNEGREEEGRQRREETKEEGRRKKGGEKLVEIYAIAYEAASNNLQLLGTYER